MDKNGDRWPAITIFTLGRPGGGRTHKVLLPADFKFHSFMYTQSYLVHCDRMKAFLLC